MGRWHPETSHRRHPETAAQTVTQKGAGGRNRQTILFDLSIREKGEEQPTTSLPFGSDASEEQVRDYLKSSTPSSGMFRTSNHPRRK